MRLRKKQRLTLAFLVILAVGAAAALILTALEENIAFFVTPTQVAAGEAEAGGQFRLGGLVVEGSVEQNGAEIAFALTDGANAVPVRYVGILPDLFREGQGIVATGTIGGDGAFEAAEVLAKHDENYMPKEVADALKASGHWQELGQELGRDPGPSEERGYAQ